MKRTTKRIALSVALAVAVVAALGFYADLGALAEAIAMTPPWRVGAGLLLALGNYVLRFVRWEMYLRFTGVRVPTGQSLAIFLSGFAMAITPGKVGELLKSFLLRDLAGVPVARSAPAVVAERLLDFLALLLLCIGGVFTLSYGIEVFVVLAALSVGFIALVTLRPVAMAMLGLVARIRPLARFVPLLTEAYQSMAVLVAPKALLLGLALSVPAWYLECVALHVLIGGYPGTTASLADSTFIYAFATVAGAVTFLPGGLGMTEGSMVALLHEVFSLVPSREVAAAVTLLVRLCTLWFAVALGFAGLAWVGRRLGMTATEMIEEEVPKGEREAGPATRR
jgi:uncharacterized protein (TIRG00374 family)